MKVGFIGLGSMGTKMALNLVKAGFDVVGYNRTREKEAPLIATGGRSAESLAAMGEECDAVVLCLPDGDVVRSMLLRESGLLSGPAPKVRYVVDCSTIDVTAAQEIGKDLMERGVYYFDSPVSGGPEAAQAGALTIMVGGDETVFSGKVRPIYEAMGKKIMYFGPNGSAQQIKLINQIMTWANYAVICEAAVLAKKAGLDEEKLHECIMTSFGYSKVFDVFYKSHIIPEDHENPTGMKMLHKDLKLAQKFAAAYGAKLPMTDTAMVLYDKAIEDGYGEKDQCVIMEQLK